MGNANIAIGDLRDSVEGLHSYMLFSFTGLVDMLEMERTFWGGFLFIIGQ